MCDIQFVPPPLSLVWSHRTLQIKSVFIKRFIEVVIDDCWKPKLINFSRYWKIYVLVKFTTVRHTICPTPYAYLLTKVQGVRSWFFYHKWQLVVIAYVENIKLLTHFWRKKMLKYSQIFYLSILSHPLCLPPDQTTRSYELIFSPKMAIGSHSLWWKYQGSNSFLKKKMLKYSQIFYLSILSHPLCLSPDQTARS